MALREMKLTPLQQRELIKTLEDNLLKGVPNSESINSLAVDYGISQDLVSSYLLDAVKNIVEFTSRDLSTLIDSHVYIYEQVYRFFEETNNTSGLLKTLAYKEKLLGLHREDTLVEINNTTNVELTVEQKYNFTKLSLKKQERLKELMKKTVSSKKIVVGESEN